MILKLKNINQIFILFELFQIKSIYKFFELNKKLFNKSKNYAVVATKLPNKDIFLKFLEANILIEPKEIYNFTFWVKLSHQFLSSILLIDEPELSQYLYRNLSCPRSFMNLSIDVSFKIAMIFCPIKIIRSTYLYRRISINRSRFL